MSQEDQSLPDHLNDNIAKISTLTHRYEDEAGKHQRFIERLTAAIAVPRSLYAIGGAVFGWVAANTWFFEHGRHVIDPPPFFGLQGVCTLTAILLSTMVLISQRHQGDLARRREQFELQVNILTEQKATKLIALLEELRHDLPNVRDRVDKTAADMAQSADPDAVVRALEEKLLPDSESKKPSNAGK